VTVYLICFGLFWNYGRKMRVFSRYLSLSLSSRDTEININFMLILSSDELLSC